MPGLFAVAAIGFSLAVMFSLFGRYTLAAFVLISFFYGFMDFFMLFGTERLRMSVVEIISVGVRKWIIVLFAGIVLRRVRILLIIFRFLFIKLYELFVPWPNLREPILKAVVARHFLPSEPLALGSVRNEIRSTCPSWKLRSWFIASSTS